MLSSYAPAPLPLTLAVVALGDPVVEAHGFHRDHPYVEATRSKQVFEPLECWAVGGGVGD